MTHRASTVPGWRRCGQMRCTPKCWCVRVQEFIKGSRGSVMITSAYPPLIWASAYHERAILCAVTCTALAPGHSTFRRVLQVWFPPLATEHHCALFVVELLAVQPAECVSESCRSPRVCHPWETLHPACSEVLASFEGDQELRDCPTLGVTGVMWPVLCQAQRCAVHKVTSAMAAPIVARTRSSTSHHARMLVCPQELDFCIHAAGSPAIFDGAG